MEKPPKPPGTAKPPVKPSRPDKPPRRPSTTDGYSPCESNIENKGSENGNPFSAESDGNQSTNPFGDDDEVVAVPVAPLVKPPKRLPQQTKDNKSSSPKKEQTGSSSPPSPATASGVSTLPSSVVLDVFPARSNRRNKQSDESSALIFHKNSISELWLVIAFLIHCVQWGLLLAVGNAALPLPALVLLTITMVVVAGLMIYTRYRVRKKRYYHKVQIRKEVTPDDETDAVPDAAIHSLVIATILEGTLIIPPNNTPII